MASSAATDYSAFATHKIDDQDRNRRRGWEDPLMKLAAFIWKDLDRYVNPARGIGTHPRTPVPSLIELAWLS